MTHTNAAGDKLVDNCLDTAEDRVCVDCGETIGQSCHLVTTVVAQDCKTLGYTVVACADCGTVVSTTVNTEFGAHKYGTPVVVEPTYATEGTKTSVCSVCGDNKVETIAKKSGLNIKLEAANKYDFVEYVDGSYVVVKIVADANNVNTWSFKFTVSYNEAVLNFVEGAVATTIAGTTASGLVSAKDGVATVLGFASNNADGKMQNIALNGEDIVLATLVFKVDSDAEATAAFAVETVEIVDKAGADVDAATTITTEDATIVTQLYLDINNDGVIDLEDLNAMVKIMANEVAADAEIIRAAADANHDGAINEADLSILLNTLVK
jgi:predicted ester cyclase